MEKDFKIKISLLIKLFLFFLISMSIAYIVSFIKLKQESREESSLLNTTQIEQVELVTNDFADQTEKQSTQITERMVQVRTLQKQYPDIVGWIEIEDTHINYPVLQGENNEYYLNHNYKKKKTIKGSIFLDKDYDWNSPSCNLLIYGHNIKNGEMFKDLLNYSSQNYYKKHPIIRFTTANEDSEYEIFSVFRSRVYYKSEKNVFRYYNFIDTQNEDEYNAFIKNAKKASLYDIDVTANYKDPLITLITCSYHVEDGRFVVVGRRKSA